MAYLSTVLAALIIFTGVFANADGQLNIAFQNQEGFNKMQIKEMDGVRQGTWITSGGNYPVAAYMDGDMLLLSIGAGTDYLKVTDFGTRTWYVGKLWSSSKFSNFDAFTDKNGNIRITGTVAEHIKFDVFANPSKGAFQMYWGDMIIDLKTTPAKGAGTCKGALKSGTFIVGTITCQSKGSMENALFNNTQDIISWMVHMFIFPKED